MLIHKNRIFVPTNTEDYGARMCGEEYFIIFDVLFSIHFINDKGLIFFSQILVFLDFLFECHNLLYLWGQRYDFYG